MDGWMDEGQLEGKIQPCTWNEELSATLTAAADLWVRGGDIQEHSERSMPREDEFLLHDVDITAGPSNGCTQHDLLWVVATHSAHPPLLEHEHSEHDGKGDEISGDPDQAVFIWTHQPDGGVHLQEDLWGL